MEKITFLWSDSKTGGAPELKAPLLPTHMHGIRIYTKQASSRANQKNFRYTYNYTLTIK